MFQYNSERNKSYCQVSLLANPEIFDKFYEDYELSESTVKSLAKDLGFSYDFYEKLLATDESLAHELVKVMCGTSKRDNVLLLADDTDSTVSGYTFEISRTPLLNHEFMTIVHSFVDANSDEIEIDQEYYLRGSTESSILMKKKALTKIDVKTLTGTTEKNYEVGVLLTNKELENAAVRLVVYFEGQPYYLPSSLYSSSTTRYRKTTGDSKEALNVMLLKILDDFRSEDITERLYTFYYKNKESCNSLVSYEEYRSVLNTMKRIPTIIETESSSLLPLINIYDDFEVKYTSLETSKSSYLWRCTALGDITMEYLYQVVSKILNLVDAPMDEYYQIRDLIGNYMSTRRVLSELAYKGSK